LIEIMLKILLPRLAVLCLSTWAIAVQAGALPERWTLVRSEPGIAYYLDERTLSTQATYLTYWILLDFDYGPKYDGAKPYKSARILKHADCSARTQDTKSFFQYDAPMGQGELRWASTFEDDVLRMEPVEPGGVAARLLELACASRK
jgi:hypothetical protein